MMGLRPTGKKLEVLEQVKFCDFCKRDFDPMTVDDAAIFTFNFGYASKRDGQTWTWDVCDDCSEAVLKRITPLIKDPLNDEYHGAD